jgi:glutamate carboxypeptidase
MKSCPRLLLSLVLSLPLSLAAALAPAERALADWISAHQADMVALLEKSVNIDSATENHPGVHAVADLFGAELQDAGLTSRWVPLPPETQRAGHLFAQHDGKRGQRILLIGHLDTVLHGGNFRRDGEVAHGAGTNDIKGGDVVLIYALKALAAAHALDDARIVVAMTGDEESVGDPVEVCRKDLLAAAEHSDAVLAFETGVAGQGTVARRGASSWRLEVSGPTAHSSGIFSAALGDGAVYEAARIVEAWRAEFKKLPGLTCNIALLAGGAEVSEAPLTLNATGKANIIPPLVLARGDLRAVSLEQRAQAETAMRATAENNNGARTSAKVTIFHRYPPMAASPKNLALLARYDEVSRDLGGEPMLANDPAQRGAGDSAFAAPYAAVLDGLGAYGRGAHSPTEMVDLKSLPLQAARAAVLIFRLTR